MRHLGLLTVCLLASQTAWAADGPLAPARPRCEYLVNPLGIDSVLPRLSWEMQDSRRGAAQTAYRVLVATSEAKLQADQADLWDSGKVATDQSAQVVYAGKPLTSRMRCYWKVRVWDQAGQPSPWSAPAMWAIGLLKPGDWKAQWIGYDAPDPAQAQAEEVSFEGCKWVWFAEAGSDIKNAPAGSRFFRRSVALPQDATIKRARLLLAVDDQFTLFVNGKEAAKSSGQTDAWRQPAMLDLTRFIAPGVNTLALAATNTKESPAGVIGKLVIEPKQGAPVVVLVDGQWKAANQEQPGWQTPGFADSAWAAAKEIAAAGDQPWGALRASPKSGLFLPPPPYLRKSFTLQKPVKHAYVYASALGLYQLHLNGRRVADDYFTPGWTDYSKRVYYNTYDVTDLVKQGGNAIGAILADGWYAGYVGLGGRDRYGSQPRVLVQLCVEYADGTSETIVSDPSWKAAYGPHLEADFLMGETYDARKELTGWDTPGYRDAAWAPVAVTAAVKAKVQPHSGVPVRKTGELKTIKVTEPTKGAFVFDLGQNYAGFVRLKAKGPAGTKIVLRFAEMLNPDGTVYTTNLRGARCIDTYYLRGEAEEIFEPSFTFHGFRYVEVTGYPGTPPADAITGVAVNSDTPVAGTFRCSNAMLNQLYSNITWTQRANFIDIPTDCPQRDERLGWTGDAEIYVRTATYNMDVAAFFTKWLVDLEDAQSAAGAFPDVAPRVAAGEGTAAWGDAGVVCPWTIYYVYGDTRVIEKHYSSMVKWVEYLQSHSKDLLRPAEGYGDWLSIGADTPKDVLATAYFAYSTRLLAKMAKAVGKEDDARKYEALFGRIKEAFIKAYVAADGRIKGDTQTCYILALRFDLLPEKLRPAAIKYLVDDIRKRTDHLSTGFVGVGHSMPVLSAANQWDTAFKLLTNDTFPSWGYSIKYGATSIWERWDGWTKEKGFQDPGMNSFAHYSFGSVGEWMFAAVAGIDAAEPGYKRLVIHPHVGGGLTQAKASYDSIRGRIATDWKVENGTFRLKVTIPANTTATVYIPAKDAAAVTESGRPAAEAEGVKFLRAEGGEAVYEVGAGEYEFRSKE
ncbi:MAG: family 78 glycoside hydrolase catalytic domain [Pirellulales bacterium]